MVQAEARAAAKPAQSWTHIEDPLKIAIELDQRARALKSLHNSRTAVCRLPPEILSVVFACLANSTESRLWVRATFVCQHWRQVAMACTTLWTTIPFVNPTFTKAILSRSRSAPLTIDCKPWRHTITDEDIEVLRYVLPSRRIRSVVIGGNRSNLFKLLDLHWHSEVLEDLYLCVDNEYDDEEDNWLPQNILKNGAPYLSKLRLSSCGTLWSQLPLGQALTSLQLWENHTHHAHRPSASALLASLQKLPRLEALNLGNYLPYGFAPGSTAFSIVTLPGLASLVLTDTPHVIHGFLNVIQTPSVKFVDIEFGIEELSVEVLDSIFFALRLSQTRGQTGGHTPVSFSVRPRMNTLQIHEIGMDRRYQCQDLGDFEGPWSNFKFWFTTSTHGPNKELHLSLTMQAENPPLGDVLAVAKRNMYFDPLRNLQMDETISMQVEEWQQYFADLPHLEAVTIAGGESAYVALAFVNTLAADPALTAGLVASGCLTETPYFPALKTIQFDNMEVCGHSGPTFAAILTDVFKARRQSHPILELRLEDVIGLGGECECWQMQEGAPNLTVTSNRCSWFWPDWESEEDSAEGSELDGEEEGRSDD